jgi:hypothetical protein
MSSLQSKPDCEAGAGACSAEGALEADVSTAPPPARAEALGVAPFSGAPDGSGAAVAGGATAEGAAVATPPGVAPSCVEPPDALGWAGPAVGAGIGAAELAEKF